MISHGNSRRGQAMLIAVLSLGGAMIGAIAIAGFLTLYQVRASTDSVNSAKAIFAADTGINWALYSAFCAYDTDSLGDPRCSGAPVAPATLSDGATVLIQCYDASADSIDCFDDPGETYAVSGGTSLGARRSFYVNLLVATSTFP
jgi:hypothetical protein